MTDDTLLMCVIVIAALLLSLWMMRKDGVI